MDITKLLNAKEGENIEFKEAKNHFDFEKLVKYACAISNQGGGKIVLGVSDKRPRQVVGSSAFGQPEHTRKSLMDRLHIKVDFEELYDNGLRVLIFIIAARPVGLPIQADGISYWREGDTLCTMPADVLHSIYEESGHDFSADVCPHLTIDDLDIAAIDQFREKWAKKANKPSIKALSVQQLLSDCGAIDDDGVTYAALVLFGKKKAITKYLPQSEIVFEYRSSEASGPAAQREEFRDAFFNIQDDIWERINLRNDKQHYQDGFFVFDIDTFNEQSTREALLNAVSHRNYQLAGSIFIVQYRERLVVTSPGGFPPGITPDNAINKQSPRNRRIAEILAKCGLVERSGQGMNLMFENSIKEAKALPSFAGTDAYDVKLTLHGVVLDKSMLVLINRIGAATLESFTTQDFLVLNCLAHDLAVPKALKENQKRLAELGLLEKVARGKYILSRQYYSSVGKAGVHTRKKGLDRDTNKELLLRHIKLQGKAGAKLSDMLQVLPDLPRSTVQVLLREMRKNELIYSIGATSAARWFYGSQPETCNQLATNLQKVASLHEDEK